jgi:hypothetical protein
MKALEFSGRKIAARSAAGAERGAADVWKKGDMQRYEPAVRGPQVK